MAYNYTGADISYAQGNANPANYPGSFVIINASRANVGLVTGSHYHQQVDAFRAAGKEVGHYFFNGPVDVATSANYFVDNLYKYKAGDALVLDIEATGVVAWTPAQALVFAQVVYARMGVKIGLYLNKDLMDSYDWSVLVSFGCWLWIAYYNPNPPALKWWSEAKIWQTSSSGYDHDKATTTLAEISGGVAPAPVKKKGKNSMTTLYYTELPTPVPAPYAAGKLFGLAGDGVGTAAWLETQDQTLANQLAGFHGVSEQAVFLSWQSFQNWRIAYRTAAPVAGADVAAPNVDIDGIATAVAAKVIPAIPTEFVASSS